MRANGVLGNSYDGGWRTITPVHVVLYEFRSQASTPIDVIDMALDHLRNFSLRHSDEAKLLRCSHV